MTPWTYVLGGNSNRGPRALLLHDGAIVGEVSMAVAGGIVDALNAAEATHATPDQLQALHEVVTELYAMLKQCIDSRERDGFTGKESDDSKRARQLLDMAGRIIQGES